MGTSIVVEIVLDGVTSSRESFGRRKDFPVSRQITVTMLDNASTTVASSTHGLTAIASSSESSRARLADCEPSFSV